MILKMKTLTSTTVGLFMFLTMSLTAFAAVRGNIPYWEADYSQIGRRTNRIDDSR